MPTIDETLQAAHKHFNSGNLADAGRLYRDALKVDPRQPIAWHHMGLILRARGDLAGARECITRAIKLDGARASFHNDLGTVLHAQSRYDDAVASYARAVALMPEYAAAHSNLGSAYKDQGRTAEAMACYTRALACDATLAEAHFNLGALYQSEGELDRAAACYQRAKALKPNYWHALNNLGTIYKVQGRFSEALQAYEAAIACPGEVGEAHRNRALLRLMLGDFAEGWSEYEWRWRVPGASRMPFAQPRWQGESLPGGKLLIKGEQGMGDAIQFIRYAPLVRERSGANVLLDCIPALHALLQGAAGVDRVVSGPLENESFDCYVPLLSMPGLFETRLENIPARVPYLFPQADRVERWRRELAGSSGFQVGIAWQGNPGYSGDAARSVPLAYFVPLAQCPGVTLYSLQKHHGCEQLAALAGSVPIVDLGPSLDNDAAFVDTAAVMANLDLVITSDTALAHLAGALGVRTWVALQHVPDWRWLVDRDDSPWYPTMRLFRQTQPGDWQGVFARIAAELRAISVLTPDP